MRTPEADDRLAAVGRRLEDEGVIEVVLDQVGDLLSEPSIEPLGRAGPYQSGIGYAWSVLESMRRLPGELTLRILLTGSPIDEPAKVAARAALRDYCRFRIDDSRRRAAAVRQTGIRQLPRALLFAAIAAALAAACGYIGQSIHAIGAKALFFVVAGVGTIAAWIITWVPIEELLFGWRPEAHTAETFELLNRARLEFEKAPAPAGRVGSDPERRGSPHAAQAGN